GAGGRRERTVYLRRGRVTAQEPAQVAASVGREDRVEERERLGRVAKVGVDYLEPVRGEPVGGLGDGAADRRRRGEHAVLAHDADPPYLAGRRLQPGADVEHGDHEPQVGGGTREHAGPVADQRLAGEQLVVAAAGDAEPPGGRRHAVDAAPGGGDADAAADVGPDRDGDDARGDERGLATARPAGRTFRRPGVVRPAVDRVVRLGVPVE